MKRMQIIGIAFAAVLALTALTSATAFGLTFELALWLVNGADVTAPVAVDTTGELLFKNLLNGAEFRCSGVFHGFVEPESRDIINEVLSLTGTKIEELTGKGIVCTAVKVCEAGPEAYPKGLPFKTELEQDEGKFFDLIFASYEFKCKIFGITLEETCEPPAGEGIATELVNTATEVEGVGAGTPRSNCSGGAEEGEIVNVAGNLETPTGGGSLAASLP